MWKSERARNSQTFAAAATSFVMCGRFTVKMTWAEIVALYKLTLDRPPHNLPPSYNVCPTGPNRRGDRAGWQARFHADALGLGAAVVAETDQGIEGGDLQREGRDGRNEAVLS